MSLAFSPPPFRAPPPIGETALKPDGMNCGPGISLPQTPAAKAGPVALWTDILTGTFRFGVGYGF